MLNQPSYWFPAKRYGWGWGLPQRWQGWVVLALFLVLVCTGIFMFPPREQPLQFCAYVAVLVALLVVVCHAKGEPPRWRWGDGGSRK